MSSDEPLSAGVTRILDELARADAAAVLSEARTQARDRLRARLTDELVGRMLHHIADDRTLHGSSGRSAPPAGDDTGGRGAEAGRAAPASGATTRRHDDGSATAVYVYAVAEAGAGPATSGLAGIADAPVRVVTSEATGLQALVSDVPLEQFGDEALRRNLNDLAWLSAAALRHEGTVEAAMAETTLVPLRMCTIFRDDDGVRAMLAREEPALAAAMARLRNAQEWGVKVIADTDAFAAAVATEEQGAHAPADQATGEGAGYFAALRRDRVTREEVARELDRRARQIHDAVSAMATDVRLHPPSSRDLSGYEGEMVLNGAYLVSADRTDDLRALTRSLAERHRADGLAVELTGPWPPYNFSMPAGGL
jgi:Gas vesicle synthesis protein GvpL/GvpF